MSVVTKKGDDGTTGTLSGQRVSKADFRIELEGCIDELNTHIGFARSLIKTRGLKDLADELMQFQLTLFRLGAEVSMASDAIFDNPICEEDIAALEKYIADRERSIELPDSFLVPGNTTETAALEIARASVRRLERRAVAAGEKGLVPNKNALIWLNRASDYLFVLIHAVEKRGEL